MGKVIVLKIWFYLLLVKCKGYGVSFIVKKIVDGFFEFDKLILKIVVELVDSDVCMELIKCKYVYIYI